MLKKIALCLLLNSPIIALGQITDSAFIYFKLGVNAVKNSNFSLADSMYSRSIQIKDHVNPYFNRGALRGQRFDSTGYCTDMAFAAGLGDKEANTLFHKYCGTTNSSILKKQEDKPIRSYNSHYQVIYQSKFMLDTLIARYRQNGSFHSFCWMQDSKKVIFLTPDSTKKESLSDYRNSEFPGGFPAMMLFIQNNLNYPPVAREAGLSGKVFLQFMINTLGYIENIEVVKGMPNCKDCDEEAVRVIAAMPRWQPAMQKGKAVRTYFKLPFTFRINR